MTFIPIAWSNLFRNSRRTISTLLAFLIGVSMIVFVNGFNTGLQDEWANGLIDGWNGHFSIRHKHYDDNASTEMEKIYIENPAAIERELRKNPHITGVMASTQYGGLIGQENKSTTFIAMASDVSVRDSVLPTNGEMIVEGENLKPGDPQGAILGKLLAKSLDVKIGDELVVLSNSIYAEQTAIVIQVRGLLRIPGAQDIEKMIAMMDIDQVQHDLLDMGEGATELVVRIDNSDNLESVITWVNKHFESQGQPWVAVPWYTDKMFQQVTGMFNAIGFAIWVILLIIVCIVIFITLLMSTLERVREIGTLRAIGTEKIQVYMIFYFEAMIISVVGIILGLIFGSIFIFITAKTGISIPASEGELISVFPKLQFSNLFFTPIVLLAFIQIAVLFPIISSCKMDVIDALNYR